MIKYIIINKYKDQTISMPKDLEPSRMVGAFPQMKSVR